jgi:hypothetical protein
VPRRPGASIPVPPTLPPLRPVGNTAPPPPPAAPRSAPAAKTLMMAPAVAKALLPDAPAAPERRVELVPDPPILPPGRAMAEPPPARAQTPPPARAQTPPPGRAQTPPPQQAPVAPQAMAPQVLPPFHVATPPPAPAAYPYPDDAIQLPPGMLEGQAAPAVWRQAHPSAQRWAERRQKSGVAASAVPSPPRMALGLLVGAIGVWLLVSFIPSRRPLDAAEKVRVSQQAGVDQGAWRFSRPLHGVALGGAALYLAVGLLVALRGAFFRRGDPRSRRSAIALGVSFALLTVAMIVVVAVASLGGPAG